MNTLEAHAQYRIDNRLAGLVNQTQVEKAVKFAQTHPTGKFYVEIVKFAKLMHIDDNSCGGTQGAGVNGDAIVAVVKFGRIATVMLTKSWRKEYFSDGRYVQ